MNVPVSSRRHNVERTQLEPSYTKNDPCIPAASLILNCPKSRFRFELIRESVFVALNTSTSDNAPVSFKYTTLDMMEIRVSSKYDGID